MTGRSRNLLKNPCAKGGLRHWETVRSGGNGFKCEKVPAGSKRLSECGHKRDKPCWATSHQSCEKRQLACLLAPGISGERLDEKKPPIIVRDWYTSRTDCGCEYRIFVRLLADDKKTELDKWEYTDTLEKGSDWKRAKHVFKDYPSGVRYVDFVHGGKDTRGWAGHYGVKMTKSGVFVGKNPKPKGAEKNLLENSSAQSGLDGWEVTANGGDGLVAQKDASVMEQVENAESPTCWATSHTYCEKMQIINLEVNGFGGSIMDGGKPEIKIIDWYTSHGASGCEYSISACLLAGDKETELDKWEHKDTLEQGSEWKKAKHVFKNYPPGVRYVSLRHGGKDTKYWAGHYGVKMTKSGVFVGKKIQKKVEEGSEKNLLENSSAQSGVDGWEVTANGGDGLVAQKDDSVMGEVEKAESPTCWATSHSYCEKKQIINLEVNGFGGSIMDGVKPEIKVIDWYKSHGASGGEYTFSVRLLAGDKETELDQWEHKDTLEQGSEWIKVKHMFKNYPPGVRYVEFRHGGKDTKYWAGHYGVKMTKSGVFVGKKIKKEVKAENLLTNPFAMSGLDGWQVTANGGNGLVAEMEAAGCTPVMGAVDDAEWPSCWATSHSDCEKKQVINLEEKGISGYVMDEAKPDIKVKDWFSPRGDAGCHYWMMVRLLKESGEEVARREVKEMKNAGEPWAKVKLSFTDYTEGVRMIEFSHGGKDNCCWAGHYGAKMTHSSVVVEPKKSPFDSSSSSSDDEN